MWWSFSLECSILKYLFVLQGHKVILSACSPYFKKILKDNPCRHPVLILNDMELEVLDALMTYMYHGTVSVPHNKLQLFLKTAEALKIKGIVDTTCDSGSDTSSLLSPPHQPGILPVQELLTIPQPLPLLPPVHQHPAGDLSLLASAASEQASAQVESSGPPQQNNKRRKTAPRKLGTYLINNSSHLNRAQYSPGHKSDEEGGDTEKENNRLISQLINKDRERDRETAAGPGLLKEGLLLTNGKVSAINLTKAGTANAQNSAGLKEVC